MGHLIFQRRLSKLAAAPEKARPSFVALTFSAGP
jgi:hypothetical protein